MRTARRCAVMSVPSHCSTAAVAVTRVAPGVGGVSRVAEPEAHRHRVRGWAGEALCGAVAGLRAR
ncbi:hypothetical protein ACU4GD_30445 [Cupriavidus basilensis]